METLTEVIALITGEAGAVVVMALGAYLWLSGKLFSRSHVDLLEAEHDELAKANAATQDALQDVSRTTTESLENSKTILRIIQSSRRARAAEAEARKEDSE